MTTNCPWLRFAGGGEKEEKNIGLITIPVISFFRFPQNATLLAENKILKLQTDDSHKRISTVESQNTNLHTQLSSVQQQYNTAQMDNAKLQVETTTLKSHNQVN